MRSTILMPELMIASYFISDMLINLWIFVIPSQCRASGLVMKNTEIVSAM